MKNLFALTLILGLILSVLNSSAQGIAINTDNSAPDPSAMLDVKSTNKGLLAPRMTLAQRSAITNPATGLTIFQIDVSPGLYFNAGSPAVPLWTLVGSNAGQWQNSGSNIYYNSGYVGIGTTIPESPLSVVNVSMWGISTPGSFQIGQSDTYNMVFNAAIVQARNNGGGSPLYLQYWGGDITACTAGGTASFGGAVNVFGKIGVKTTPLYDLHINSSDYTAASIYSPYPGGTVAIIYAGGTTAGTWGLYAYATSLGYAGYFSGNVFCTGSYLPSDEKLKENIQPFENSLDKIMQLDVMTYNYNTSGFPELNLPTDRQNGFTAQNLETVFPELVKVNPAKKEQPVEFKAVNYTGLIPVLTAAIQEQQKQLDDKDKRIEHLQNQFTTLENHFNDLKDVVFAMQKGQ